MIPDLSIYLAGQKLKNPLMNAAGTFGFGAGYANIKYPHEFGALVSKTITLKPRKGNPQPWIARIGDNLINSVGWANEGIDSFINETLPKFEEFRVPIVLNVGGFSIDEYKTLAIRAHQIKNRLLALELDASCPNVQKGKLVFSSNPETTKDLVKTVRKATDLPLIVKLNSLSNDISDFAKAAEMAGADVLAVINTIPALAVNYRTKRPLLGGNTGGLSGPAIKNVSLLKVLQAKNSVKLPIIGIGGIATFKDVLEYLIVGASAVAIGTANYFDAEVNRKILNDLKIYMKENKIEDIKSLIGKLELN